ncbi:hypothetical protein JTE90_012353 [Oedothorax gibbosus]|uniref:Nuclear pore complex protein Nup153 n=1 Tax=Oedothorax gibbosus TaxID=931172 RepID=A0AAV6V7K7_9ARAC|nr:hypothetical protein JTE90_012353 [Oedothorax gibbosus]
MERRTLRNKKSKTRNAKPYDRPNQQQQQQQNQSIFGRVASKFKGILNPSWIFNVSQWMGTPEEDNSSSNPQDSESGEEEEEQQTPAPTAPASKRPRLNLIDAPTPPPILSEGTQTWLDTPSSSLFSPSSLLTSTVNQNSLLENKADQDQVIINGDDHSENSEGSASTSGCSSLVSSHKERSNCLPVPNRRLVQSPFDSLRSGFNRRDFTSRKEVLPADMSESRMSLWSGSRTFSPAAKMQQRSPVVGQSNQPSFSIGAFMGSSKTSQQSDKKVASPFYQGKTSFGGASSTRRMPVSVAPYQVDRPSRNQIKVRPKESEDSLEGMSSAAKRILMTLEKMSSPVTDAKKIPNTNRSPVDLSLYLMPPRLRSNVVSTPTSSKGPPIADISTISKLTTLKSCMRLQNPNASRGEWLSEPKETKITPPVSDISQRTAQQQDSIPPPLSPNKGPGKMRCKLTQKHQSSVRSEEFEHTPLPSIPLPISTLPIFKQVDSKATSQSSTKVTNDDFKPSIEFEFSPPIEMQPTLPPLFPSNISTLNSDKSTNADKLPFTFSTPAEVELPKPAPGLFVHNLTSSKRTSSSSWLQNPDKEVKSTSSEAPKNNLKTSKDAVQQLSAVSSSATKPLTSWSCQECWIQNPANEAKCLACETPKKSPATSGLLSQLTKSSPTWACHECWTQNPECETKCLACETVKKGECANVAPKISDFTGFGGNSSTKSTWSCSSCWIQNPMKEAKCLACEAPNPSADKSSGSSVPSTVSQGFKSGFNFPSKMVSSAPETTSPFIKAIQSNEVKKPVDQNATPNGTLKISSGFTSDWECDICLVRNPSDTMKCQACEAVRPSKRNNSGLKDSESFKFNSPLQNSPITFKFGSYSIPATTATAVSTCSFGNLTTTSTSSFLGTGTNLSTTTTSSEQSKTTSNSQPALGFKFGTTTVPVIDITEPEIPVVDLVDNEDNVQPASVFGSIAKKTNEDTTSTSKTFNIPLIDKPSDITSTFLQPPKTSTDNKLEEPKSTVDDSSNSKPAMSLFKFGAANQQPKETATSNIPVIDLLSNDINEKGTDMFSAAVKAGIQPNKSTVFSVTPSVGSTNFALPTSSENKQSPFASVKENSMPTLQQTLNSTPVSSQTGQSKETPLGGFNFKAPTALANSAFGGFSMASSSDTSKALPSSTSAEKLNVSITKTSDSPFALGVSSASNSSPFASTAFKMSSQVDAPKTTKSPFGTINVSAPTSSSAAPVFSFGAGQTTTSAFGVATTTTSSLQFPTKSLDVKPATQFNAAPTTSAFSFGSVATATTIQSSAPSGGFSFFAAATTAAANPGLFTFGASSNASQAPKTSGK